MDGNKEVTATVRSPADRCTRCRGDAILAFTQRTYQGVPGLCWDCAGVGTREAQEETRRERAVAALKDRAHAAALAPVLQIRETQGTMPLPRERRRWARAARSFPTAQYAQAFGMTLRAAFVELSRASGTLEVAFDGDLKPTGWRYG